VHHGEGHGLDGGPREPPRRAGQGRAARHQVDRHAAERVDRAERVGALGLHRPGDRDDVAGIGRELHPERRPHPQAHGSYDLGQGLRIGGDHPTPFGTVRAGGVQLERHDPRHPVEAFGAGRELLGAVAPEIGDHPRARAGQLREALAQEGVHPDVLEADRVQHAGRCLEKPGAGLPS
jgi:hypothetical protein